MSISRNNSIWYKFLAVLLVVALLFTFVLPRPQAKAIALVDDAVLVAGAAVAVMIAAGIYFTSQNTDADTFGAYISGKIDDFIASEGTGSVSEYASGISLNPNGVGLNVSDPTMRFLDRFLNWFKADESLTSETSTLFNQYQVGDITLTPYFSSTDRVNPPSGTHLIPGQVYSCGPHNISCRQVVGETSTSFQLYNSDTNAGLFSSTISSISPDLNLHYFFICLSKFDASNRIYVKYGYCYSDSSGIHYSWPDLSGWGTTFANNITTSNPAYHHGSLSASYTANTAYSVSDTQTGTMPFIIVIDETASGGSGGNNNKHDTARDAAISALQLGLVGKLLSSVTQSSSDSGQEGGDSNVSADVSGIRAAVNSIKNWLDNGFKTFSEVCTQFFTDVRLFFADFWTNFTTKLQEVFKTSLDTIKELLSNIKTGISSAAESIKTAVSTAADTIGGKIDSIGTKISDWWEEWRSSKNDKPSSFFGAGFNSIWHYVVEWLSYIGGFLSLVLNVWSVLPYGMVVPVYASVVLILYFGIYRKFIK